MTVVIPRGQSTFIHAIEQDGARFHYDAYYRSGSDEDAYRETSITTDY